MFKSSYHDQVTRTSEHTAISQKNRCSSGFALIAALSVMSILVMIAISLFSLSYVNTTVAAQAQAKLKAQANAKMAMMIAMGELQKNIGPDRAITATAEILATESSPAEKPNTTGVWESWAMLDPNDPNASLNYSAEKAARFKRWLVSAADETLVQSPEFVKSAWTGRTIELVGDATLGGTADDADKVTAGLVAIPDNGANPGAYAWHVADESVKARVNLYRDPSRNTTLAEKRALAAGHRPDASLIKNATGDLLSFLPNDYTPAEYADAQSSQGKMINLAQTELLDSGSGKLKPLRNDITLYSRGVLTNVLDGGLKLDLSSAFEMGDASANTLPSAFTNGTLYKLTHGITGASDPKWGALAGYYNSFRNLTNPETDPTYELQENAVSIDLAPGNFQPAPVITKVETIFSLIVRPLDKMKWWISNPTGEVMRSWDYVLNLIYTPVVALHNPYNVSLSFHKIDVTFENVPVAFNFMFQPGENSSYVSRSVIEGDFDSLNSMVNDPNGGRGDKIFTMSIANWSDEQALPNNNSMDSPIILKPGQTLICGPIFPPNSNYDQDTKSGPNSVGFDWDWNSDRTRVIKSRPGLIPGLGFETNSITIAASRPARNKDLPVILTENGQVRSRAGTWGNQSALPLRDANDPNGSPSAVTDRFYVEYKVQRPEYYKDDTTNIATPISPEFKVTAQIQTIPGGALVDFANLEFSYQNDNTLQDIFQDRIFRYPPEENGYLTGSEVAAPSQVSYSEQSTYVNPFAVFSAYTRTTNGGVYETGQRTENGAESPETNLLLDGRLAGKPFLFHSSGSKNLTLNLANEKPGIHAYEMNFQPFASLGDFSNYLDVDAANRIPALSGNTSSSGIKVGSYLEVPSGPLQAIADFRRSNALTTSYQPHFAQPVANSFLHPLMSADRVIESDANISAEALLDHSFLANHALYDRFYFSTFATRGSDMPDTVFEEFMNGSKPLASQAFMPYLPDGQTLATAKEELYTPGGKPENEAYQNAAEYQMVQGPFNVNSTSVQAWKAVLGAMNRSEITALLTNGILQTAASPGIPFTPMSLPNGASIPAGSYADKDAGWNGYRELTESELQTLAEKIVAEVRKRGPFLSMSEFVNRQIGPAGPLTLSGALEAAITEAEINEPLSALSADSFLQQVPITTNDISDTDLYDYKTPEASTGNPAAGAPGWVSQGDLLRILEPAATVRGDTFVIRVYGEDQDSGGNVTARAYAEAVVQRMPEYIDPTNRPSVSYSTATTANKKFGRRLEVVSFRWLSSNEI